MLQKIAVFLLSLLVLAVVLFGYLLWFANTGKGRQVISATASNMLEREVRYTGSASLRTNWPPTLRITELRIANAAEGRADTLLDIKTAMVGWSPFALLRGALRLPYIFINGGELHLERYADGRANWQFGDKPSTEDEDTGTMLELGTLYLRDATATYYDVPQNIDLTLKGRTEQGELVATGEGTYLGKAFALEVKSGAILEAREDAPYPLDGTLTVGETTLHAKGTLQNPTELEGMDMTLRLRGEDASELFPLLGIALPPTAPYDIRGELQYSGDVWRFVDFTGTMGKSDLSGTVIWDQSPARPKLTANFLSTTLDFKDLAPLIGAERGALSDPSSPYIIPDVPLDISRLAAMDAEVEFIGNQVISPALPLDDFLLRVSLDNRVLHIHPVKFGTADGDISAEMRIDAQQEPVQITSDFRFARLSLARLTEGIRDSLPGAKEADGIIGGTAKLQGQGKSLKQMLSTANGNIGIGMEGGQLSNLLVELMGLDIAQSLGFLLAGDEVVPVRCIIGDFAVKDGIMQSRAVVLDTADTKIQGGGTINLATEEMDLRLVAQPKDNTIASLRTPLRVEGTLKNPDVIIEKGALLARGAGVAVLSLALTPAAGLIALLEPAMGEDSNCTALLTQMEENTGTTGATSEVPTNPMPAASPVTAPIPVESEERTPRAQENIVTHPGEAGRVVR